MKKFLGAMALVLMTSISQAAIEEGINYQIIGSPQPTGNADTIEVIELFWYGCPHCYQVEPDVQAWLKSKPADVTFIRMPAVLGPSWELLARGYYTAELMDMLEAIHTPLFDRIHKDRQPVRTPAELRTFFMERGASGKDFDKTFNSFAVITKTNRAKQATDMYGIHGVPTLVVNGTYRTTAQLAGGNKQMLEVVDFLVEKERTKGKAAAAK